MTLADYPTLFPDLPTDDLAVYLAVETPVHYWEDAQTSAGELPGRDGQTWKPVIELNTGRVLHWPKGVKANVSFKVSDEGRYYLLNDQMAKIRQYHNTYVPSVLDTEDYLGGDYIVLEVNAEGVIEGWRPHLVELRQWPFINH